MPPYMASPIETGTVGPMMSHGLDGRIRATSATSTRARTRRMLQRTSFAYGTPCTRASIGVMFGGAAACAEVELWDALGDETRGLDVGPQQG